MNEEPKLPAVPAESRFTLKQRIALRVVPWLARTLLILLGRTLRFEHSWEGDPPLPAGTDQPPPGAIIALWHTCIFPATYYFRTLDVAILISSSFDGELITRVISPLGYRVIRGSSTRGAVRGLLGMHEQAGKRAYTVFTADGPKGPRLIAKPGPLLVARSTQQPIYCFHLAPRRAWQMNSWDRTLIPKPFTKVHLRWSKPISIPATAGSEEMKAFQQQMQAALEAARLEAERRVKTGEA
jgi:hypothetical protein